MMKNNPNVRLHGLDTLRAFAIIIVLLYHYMVVVSNENTFGFMTQIGWMGVDLFFVLSGYLIGNQLLSALAKKDAFSINTFYIRRLLRTLPNYYFVLLLYFIFPTQLTGATTAPLWQFLTFTQNLDFRPGTTFSHSWSLCIEEQFYFIFPALFILIAKSRHFVLLSWILLGLGMAIGLGARIDAWYYHGESAMNWSDYYHHIYYFSFTRFDELLPGIAIAMLKNFHPKQFNILLKHANKILGLGIVSISLVAYCFYHYQYTEEHGFTMFINTAGYSLIAMSFALLALSTLSRESYISKIRIPGATHIALWSYAIYLIHKPLFKLLIEPLNGINIDVKSALGVSIIMGISVLAGWMLYQLIETPFMNIRSKYFPTNK